MRGSRTVVAVATALTIALSGGSALATVSQGSPGAAAPHGRFQGKTVLISCLNRPEVRPDFFMLACGDGTAYLTRLRWATWTSSLASGTAEYSLNPCHPACARGIFITRPVTLIVWLPAAVPHRHGRQQFLRMTIIYTGKPPAGSAQSFTESLWYPTR
ncbi:MAG TPA: hypothetical protein VKS82_11500 [Streptosporangiaceae bacterium]|nr:hypothetical protein [Streptosporangiaceae bacterium]